MVKSVVNFSHLRSDPSHPAVSLSQFLVIFLPFYKIQKNQFIAKNTISMGNIQSKVVTGVYLLSPSPSLSLGYSRGTWALTLVVIVAHVARSACVGPPEVIAVTGDTHGQLL